MNSTTKTVYLAFLIHRYGLRHDADYLREPYSQWITIGGRPEGNKQHAGGTPVRIDDQGRIEAGPPALRGRKLTELGGPDKSARKLKRSESLAGQQFLFAGAKRPQEARPRQLRLAISEEEERHPLPPTVRKLRDGRVTGHALVTIDELEADPDRFQYKTEGVDPKTGTTAELKEVKQYRPEFGGQLLVWRDPATGTNYVVNGHHRFELAKRS